MTLPINETATRSHSILKVDAIELLEPNPEGMDLNEGYNFVIDGPIPQVADGLAKMMLAMDDDKSIGNNAGEAFLGLINTYYLNNKGGK